MKINEKSWHYKIVDKDCRRKSWGAENAIKTNLCPYVRALCWALLKKLLTALGVTVVGMLVIGLVVFAPYQLFTDMFAWGVFVALATVLGSVVWLAGIVGLITWVGIKLSWWLVIGKQMEKFALWIAARHEAARSRKYLKKHKIINAQLDAEDQARTEKIRLSKEAWEKWKVFAAEAEKNGEPEPPRPFGRGWRVLVGEATTWDLVMEWLQATHDNLCPQIEIVKDETDTKPPLEI